MDVNQEFLRKQIMINQFCNQVGCAPEQATEILQAARWQIEVAFSLFFQGHAVVTAGHHHDNNTSTTGCSSSAESGGNGSTGGNSFGSRITPYACVPTNTPATPPSLPDTLAAFAQMKASSPDQRGGFETRIVHVQKS